MRSEDIDLRTTKCWLDARRDIYITSDYKAYFASVPRYSWILNYFYMKRLKYVYIPAQDLRVIDANDLSGISDPSSDLAAIHIKTQYNMEATIWRDKVWVSLETFDSVVDPNIKLSHLYLYPAKDYLKVILEYFNVANFT